MTLKTRAEVPVEETWALSDLFASEEAFEANLIQAQNDLHALEQWQNKTLTSAQDLVQLLVHRDEFMKKSANLERYASLLYAEEASSNANQERLGRVHLFIERVSEVLSALRAQISKVSTDQLHRFLETEPSLEPYGTYLNELIQGAEHRLSDDAEAVLSSLSSLEGLPYKVYQSAVAADMVFPPVKNSAGEDVSITPFYVLMNVEVSTDAEFRRRAYESLNEGLRPHQHTLAASLGANIQRDVTLARVRKYPTVFDYLQHQSDEGDVAPNMVSPEHFFMVQDIMMTHLAPHMRRYARLRKKVLGLEKSLLCDVKAPLESLQGSSVPFSEAKNIILNAASPLGDVYGDILRRAFDERWIYRARNAGQVNMAFCSPNFVHPYVFSPYAEQLYDVLILGHELGHAVHLNLTYSNQNPTNTRFSTLFVEAPSTLMEHFIVSHLRTQQASPELARKLTMLQLFTFHHNFVTHQLEAEILRRLYTSADSGQPLTTNTFRQISRKTLEDFWGDSVELDESADLYWMRQPHYYNGIYAYTYAVGLVGSTVMAERIRKEGEPAVRQWVEVLKSGSTRSPLELFKMAGIDMSSPEPYLQAVAFVGELIDELERSYL